MNASANRDSGGAGATVVTSQKVVPGCEEDYQRWQEQVNRAVRDFEGFEGTELYPPDSPEDNQWVVVFRFSDVDRLTAWLRSGTRRQLLHEGRELFEEEPSQEVLRGGQRPQEAVTAVISHDVKPGRERDFVGWQDKILKAQERYPGFMGSELFAPVEGIQDRWVVVFRFDTREHLDQWLESDVREKLLTEGRDYFAGYDVREIASAFSGWFRFGEGEQAGVPPNWKQAMSVLLALYPTVMVLNLTAGRALTDAGVPGYLGLFISNVLSVAILTWFMMPLVVNRALAFWLAPDRPRSRRVDMAGAAVVAVCYAALVALFGLTT
ncbi:antibiotic biosynthesis monooxygenase [Streptomyces yaanensis]|uniref:Antibiotic biosynthesis monooxygenase n=1 Tax=Streptomyces yaanensis TaxID=1142239 RepID=A0ABV7SC25_9ACTN|nr:antibiotic biosynthesis monooxygenase [Streptomyces sp. CGMCC 4.7035]WNC02858.1 antibiotic biosynthesis monooxygenase [Streptomyces sp. CGMCC 4.7035]